MSSFNIKKFNLDNRIALSFYKHRGDVEAVAEEIRVELPYVKKITSKLKRKIKRDVASHLAMSIMSEIWMGYKQRVEILSECVNELRGAESAEVSLCCSAPVRVNQDGSEFPSTCLKCGNPTHTHVIHKTSIYSTIQKFVSELREESKHLGEFAKMMGFTLVDMTPPPQQVYKQNIIVLGSEGKDLSTEDRQRVMEVDQMTGMERQTVRRKIERSVVEGETK